MSLTRLAESVSAAAVAERGRSPNLPTSTHYQASNGFMVTKRDPGGVPVSYEVGHPKYGKVADIEGGVLGLMRSRMQHKDGAAQAWREYAAKHSVSEEVRIEVRALDESTLARGAVAAFREVPSCKAAPRVTADMARVAKTFGRADVKL